MGEINPNIFSNTKTAFSYKTDRQLKKAYLLFKVLDYPTFASFGIWCTKVGLKLHLPIKGIIKNTIFQQFCGGESIQDSEKAIETLSKFNIGTILDYSVEGESETAIFEATKAEILLTIDKSKGNPKIPFTVFKLTGVGKFYLYHKKQEGVLSDSESKEYEITLQRIDAICLAAHNSGTPIFIDAEETWIQNSIDSIALDMMYKYNSEKAIVYNTIQFYRKDALENLKKQHILANEKGVKLGIKMVRGAYMEKERARAEDFEYPSPIHDTKEDTDKCFNDGLKYCVENINEIAFCAGSHNEDSALLLQKLLSSNSISNNDKRVFFAQLFGMSDHISFNLASEGYNVAKYVPYGPVKFVMPYLFRRAEENTSIAGQSSRELQLISKELQRRKAQTK